MHIESQPRMPSIITQDIRMVRGIRDHNGEGKTGARRILRLGTAFRSITIRHLTRSTSHATRTSMSTGAVIS